MERPAATTRGVFHHGSVRNVRAEICARVLSGASGACVMLQRPRCFERKRNATHRQTVRAWVLPRTYSSRRGDAVIETSSWCVTLATLRPDHGRSQLGTPG